MTSEEIRHKLGVCKKTSPESEVILAMKGKKITTFVPFIKHSTIKKIEDIIMRIKEQYVSDYKHDAEFKRLFQARVTGQYGYYVTHRMWDVLNFMNILGINKICDLGCGSGIALKGLKIFDNSIEVRGYDIEEYLIRISNDKSFQVKDITTLSKEDISIDELIYLWEPFNDNQLSLKFVNNLANISSSGQMVCIMQYPYYNTITNLLNNDKFDYVCNFGSKFIFVKK